MTLTTKATAPRQNISNAYNDPATSAHGRSDDNTNDDNKNDGRRRRRLQQQPATIIHHHTQNTTPPVNTVHEGVLQFGHLGHCPTNNRDNRQPSAIE